jgi:hypothetical protein
MRYNSRIYIRTIGKVVRQYYMQYVFVFNQVPLVLAARAWTHMVLIPAPADSIAGNNDGISDTRTENVQKWVSWQTLTPKRRIPETKV